MQEGLCDPPDFMKGGIPMNVLDLMTFVEYTVTCVGIGIAIAQFFKHKK